MPIDPRDAYLKRYNITEKERQLMEKRQHNKCAICGNRESVILSHEKCDQVRRLSVDHNSKTNTVRELLCFRCNVGIGSLMEDTII